MEKKLLRIVIFSLCLAVLATHWLNMKTGVSGTAQQSNNSKAKPALKSKLATKAESNFNPTEKAPIENPAPSTEPAPQTKEESLKAALGELSKHLYSQKENFDAQEAKLRGLLQNADTKELRFLAAVITDRTQDQDLRLSAAYMLNLAGASAVPLLTEIASTPFREVSETNFEASLRTGALERIDRWAVSGLNVEASLEQILKNQKDPALQFFARTSLEGVLEKRPGKLLRLSQKSLEEYE